MNKYISIELIKIAIDIIRILREKKRGARRAEAARRRGAEATVKLEGTR